MQRLKFWEPRFSSAGYDLLTAMVSLTQLELKDIVEHQIPSCLSSLVQLRSLCIEGLLSPPFGGIGGLMQRVLPQLQQLTCLTLQRSYVSVHPTCLTSLIQLRSLHWDTQPQLGPLVPGWHSCSLLLHPGRC